MSILFSNRPDETLITFFPKNFVVVVNYGKIVPGEVPGKVKKKQLSHDELLLPKIACQNVKNKL